MAYAASHDARESRLSSPPLSLLPLPRGTWEGRGWARFFGAGVVGPVFEAGCTVHASPASPTGSASKNRSSRVRGVARSCGPPSPRSIVPSVRAALVRLARMVRGDHPRPKKPCRPAAVSRRPRALFSPTGPVRPAHKTKPAPLSPAPQTTSTETTATSSRDREPRSASHDDPSCSSHMSKCPFHSAWARNDATSPPSPNAEPNPKPRSAAWYAATRYTTRCDAPNVRAAYTSPSLSP